MYIEWICLHCTCATYKKNRNEEKVLQGSWSFKLRLRTTSRVVILNICCCVWHEVESLSPFGSLKEVAIEVKITDYFTGCGPHYGLSCIHKVEQVKMLKSYKEVNAKWRPQMPSRSAVKFHFCWIKLKTQMLEMSK